MAKEINRECPICRTSLEEILRNKSVGCPFCYECFKDSIDKMLIEIHGLNTHVDTIPHEKPTEAVLKIKQLLAKAIEAENYELAAQYRDQLREME